MFIKLKEDYQEDGCAKVVPAYEPVCKADEEDEAEVQEEFEQNAPEERKQMAQILSERVDKIWQDLAEKKVCEDYILKTLYVLIRHCRMYADDYLLQEVDVMNRFLKLCPERFDATGDYGRAASLSLEQAIFDSVHYITHEFGQATPEKNSMHLGAGIHISAGCSPLGTKTTNYKSFIAGMQDYDTWYADYVGINDILWDWEKQEYVKMETEEQVDAYYNSKHTLEFVFPVRGIDHTDDDIINMFGDLLKSPPAVLEKRNKENHMGQPEHPAAHFLSGSRHRQWRIPDPARQHKNPYLLMKGQI